MTWFKVDDHFDSHPAVCEAGDSAMGLWLRLGCRIARFPAGGDALPKVIVERSGTAAQIRRLIDAGLLLIREDGDYILNPSMSIAGSGLLGRSWSIEGQSPNRPGIPAWLRAAVYDRDGRACRECGSTSDLTLDHIYPYSLGGEDTLDNLRTLCRSCNSTKGARV